MGDHPVLQNGKHNFCPVSLGDTTIESYDFNFLWLNLRKQHIKDTISLTILDLFFKSWKATSMCSMFCDSCLGIGDTELSILF